MNLELVELGPKEWSDIVETTLKYSMGLDWPGHKTRATKALIVQDRDTREPMGYMSLVEFDSESVYLQHGGNFPASKGFLTLKTYLMMVNHVKSQYKFLSTRIFNQNIPMLKLAFAAGFRITGTQIDHWDDLYCVLEVKGNE